MTTTGNLNIFVNADPRDVIMTPLGRLHLPSMTSDLYGRGPASVRSLVVTNGYLENVDVCPRWRRFLLEAMGGDQTKVDEIQRIVGYTLTGRMDERVAYVVDGKGHGKSVFLETLHHVLGSYAGFYREGHFTHEMIPRIQNKRMICIINSGSFFGEGESLLNAVIAGDMLSTRPLYQNEVIEFKPETKLFLYNMYFQTLAIGLGLKLIEFNVEIPREKMDPDLLDDLKAECNGIFAWAAEGAKEWYRLKALRKAELQQPSGDASVNPPEKWDPLSRCQAIMDAQPGVYEGERNTMAHGSCATGCGFFGLSKEEFWPILQSWNARNSPPLPEDELRQILWLSDSGRSKVRPQPREAVRETESFDAIDPVNKVLEPLVSRCQRVMASKPGTYEGNRATRAHEMCAIGVDFGLDKDTFWPMLQSWNARNSPPLPEDELHKVLWFSDSGRHPCATLLAVGDEPSSARRWHDGRPELPPFYSIRSTANGWVIEMDAARDFDLNPVRGTREEAVKVAWDTFRDYGDRAWYDWIMGDDAKNE